MRKILIFFKTTPFIILLFFMILGLTDLKNFSFAIEENYLGYSSITSAGGSQISYNLNQSYLLDKKDFNYLFQITSSSSSSSGSLMISGSSSSSGSLMTSSSSSSSSSGGSFTTLTTSGSPLSSLSGSSSSSGGLSNSSSFSGSSSSSSGGLPGEITTVDTYILIQGKNTGLQLYTSPAFAEVTVELNKNTLAKGSIFGPDENCSKLHYHGMLRLKNDPNSNMCGWGKVIEYNSTSPNIQNASNVIHLEFSALSDLGLTLDINENYKQSLKHTNEALSALNNLSTSITSLENKSTIENNIKCAKKKTELAKNILENLTGGKVHNKDRKSLIKTLKGAIRCSRIAFRRILIKEKKIDGT